MPQAPRETARTEFGAYLRSNRERRELSVADIARVTKIPQRSLVRLEEGAFDGLPAEVFVRGFLRSYARCVGLDPEDTVRRFRDAGRAGTDRAAEAARVSGDGAVGGEVDRAPARGKARSSGANTDAIAAGGDAPASEVVSGADPRDAERGDADDVAVTAPASPGETGSGQHHDRGWSSSLWAPTGRLVRSLFEFEREDEPSRRGTVTLAVIILVIVATLTTSYWLRRPTSSGSGVTDAGDVLEPADFASA